LAIQSGFKLKQNQIKMSEENTKTIEEFNKIKGKDLKTPDEINRGFVILVICIVLIFILLGFFFYYQSPKVVPQIPTNINPDLNRAQQMFNQ